MQVIFLEIFVERAERYLESFENVLIPVFHIGIQTLVCSLCLLLEFLERKMPRTEF